METKCVYLYQYKTVCALPGKPRRAARAARSLQAFCGLSYRIMGVYCLAKVIVQEKLLFLHKIGYARQFK